VVVSNILIPNILKHIARQLSEFVALRMNEVAEITPSASRRSMVIFAWNRAVIACLY
jgi:hypothetical protein